MTAPPYPVVFLLNWGTETAVLLGVVGRGRRLRAVGAGLVANAITHPLVWFGLPVVDAAWGTKLAVAEVLVAGVEAAVLWVALRQTRCTCLRALCASVAANGVTFALTFLAPF